MVSLSVRIQIASCSVLALLEAVLEEEEGGTLILLVLLVREGESTLVVHLVSDEKLHLGEVGSDKLDELGGSLLELGNALGTALLGELGDDLLHVSANPLHEFGPGEALHLVELELVLDVDNGDTLTFVHLLLVGGNLDVVRALGDVLGLGLDASSVHDNLMGEGVREELVS